MSQREIRKWTVADSAELYQVGAWGSGYFSINDAGHVVVSDGKHTDRSIDLVALVRDLQRRGYKTPVLLRFSDVLSDRVQTLCESFRTAMGEYEYTGRYRPVFPIKVNQQRHVVEELIRLGRPYELGLEAGSKPELLVAMTLLDTPGSLLVCNGYKDAEYIETALLAQRLGRQTIIVVDRFDEIDMVIAAAKKLSVTPRLGLRAKLSTRGAGKWAESTGAGSKFGLSAGEMVEAVKRLQEADLLHALEMLHFHIGSQITAIRAIKDALRESARIYVELCGLGAPLRYIDVGGGLGVDYDGSQTNFHSSTNYSLQEYANDVVSAIQAACDERKIPHPDIVSESGRALVAHHAMLVFNVLGANEQWSAVAPPPPGDDEPQVVVDLREIVETTNRKNFVEAYHDAIEARDSAITMFNLGYLDLAGRARAEALFSACCAKLLKIVRDLDHIPEELEGLQKALCDTYYCNFSVFQSVPDHWAVKQLFPTMPLHRLKEEPLRRAILADLTCDSDGKVDQFIDLHDVKDVLELHPLRGDEPYLIGMFLIGAYQETLGDLHNLFGDTTAVHVAADDTHGYRIDTVVEGDSVNEVLGYVQYERAEMLRRLRDETEKAMRAGNIDLEESALLRRHFEAGLSGYTYLG